MPAARGDTCTLTPHPAPSLGQAPQRPTNQGPCSSTLPPPAEGRGAHCVSPRPPPLCFLKLPTGSGTGQGAPLTLGPCRLAPQAPGRVSPAPHCLVHSPLFSEPCPELSLKQPRQETQEEEAGKGMDVDLGLLRAGQGASHLGTGAVQSAAGHKWSSRGGGRDVSPGWSCEVPTHQPLPAGTSPDLYPRCMSRGWWLSSSY